MVFGDQAREVIDKAIRSVCDHRGWRLLAINVRPNHVHVVVNAADAPERVMTTFKAWATRRLIEAGFIERGTHVWSRHGSPKYLFKPELVDEKCRYVIEEQ